MVGWAPGPQGHREDYSVLEMLMIWANYLLKDDVEASVTGPAAELGQVVKASLEYVSDILAAFLIAVPWGNVPTHPQDLPSASILEELGSCSNRSWPSHQGPPG